MTAFASDMWPSRWDRIRGRLFSGTKWVVFWIAMFLIAAFITLAVQFIPVFAAVPPVVVISWLFCRQFPVIAFAGLFVLSGGFWSIEVFTGLPTGPAADALIVGLLITGILGLVKEDRPGVKRLWPGAIAVMLFVFVTFLFIFRADDAYPALYTWRLSFWYIVAALMLAYMPLPRGALWLLTRLAVLVIGAAAGYALIRWVIGPSPQESTYVESAGGYEAINGEVRLFGSMGAGHILSLWMASMTVFCFGLALGTRGPWRWISLAVSGMCAAALVGTHVRAGEAAAAAGIAFVIAGGLAAASLGARRLAAIGLATIVAGAGLAFIISNQAGKGTEKSQRFEAILNPTNDFSFEQRRFKWRTVFASLKDKPIGDGLGTSGDSALRYARFNSVSTNEVDNSYLTMALQLGLVMMILFAFMLILILSGLLRQAIEGTDPIGSTVALAAGGALVAYAIQLGFGTYIEGISGLGVWLVIGLGMRATSRVEPAAG